MTCASCANRIERKLNKVPGVTATVNYATEKAKVSLRAEQRRTDDLRRRRRVRRVRREPARSSGELAARGGQSPTDPASAAARQRLLVSLVLTVPVVAMAMVPAWQFTNWQWLSLTLAAPVVVWGALPVPPRRVDQPAPRQLHDGHADLDGHARGVRLVAVRAVLRYGGRARHDPPVRADRPAHRRRRATSTSRPPPGSPRSSSPAATSRPGPSARPARPCVRCSRWARTDVVVLRGGGETRVADRAARRRRPVRRTPRGEGRHRRRGRGGLLGRRRLDAHR